MCSVPHGTAKKPLSSFSSFPLSSKPSCNFKAILHHVSSNSENSRAEFLFAGTRNGVDPQEEKSGELSGWVWTVMSSHAFCPCPSCSYSGILHPFPEGSRCPQQSVHSIFPGGTSGAGLSYTKKRKSVAGVFD